MPIHVRSVCRFPVPVARPRNLKRLLVKTHTHTLLFSSKERYRALTKSVQIRDMVIHNDSPLATLSVLQTMTTEREGESFKRKRGKKASEKRGREQMSCECHKGKGRGENLLRDTVRGEV